MLDLKFIRENLETVQKGAEAKGATVDLPGIMSLDEHRRKLIGENDSLKARRNDVSAQIGKLKKEGGRCFVSDRRDGVGKKPHTDS